MPPSLPTHKNIQKDFAAGIVVFFVALPLCLGIALASGAPLFSGIIAGIIGGIFVGAFSQSSLSVSGPAAGLVAVVVAAISDLGSFELFLCSVIVAGILQIALGMARAGGIANYLPSCVIDGMLAAIGIIIILKQFPHALGYERDNISSESFAGPDGETTLSILSGSLVAIHPGVLIIAIISLGILIAWDKVRVLKKLTLVPGPLVAVVVGALINELLFKNNPGLGIGAPFLVQLPRLDGASALLANLHFPDLSGFSKLNVWQHGLILAVIASIETLLCIEAVDRLDPHKRFTPPDRELKAQGLGNIFSGLIGGLPITSVIVRSSANVSAGAQSKVSTIWHGLLLLVCVSTLQGLLSSVPLGALAAILIFTGTKLARPSLFLKKWNQGADQFLPFIVTVLGVVFTDILVGVLIGLGVSILVLLRENMIRPYFFTHQTFNEGDIIHIRLTQDVSFLNKAPLKLLLDRVPSKSYVILDASSTLFIDFDVLEVLKEFTEVQAPEKEIRVDSVGFKEEYRIDNTLNQQFVYLENPAIKTVKLAQ